jgi:hypothetical protein
MVHMPGTIDTVMGSLARVKIHSPSTSNLDGTPGILGDSKINFLVVAILKSGQ